MNVEQRLLRAFEQVDRVEPSADLWSRVVHSIDEDRAHRRRVVWSTVATIVVLAGLVAVGAAFVRDGPFGPYVERPAMELLEVVGLSVVVVVMGPAVRRFGRNYVGDLFAPTGPSEPCSLALLRLLDVAYYLVFVGYILMTTQFEFDPGTFGMSAARDLSEQLRQASVRLGGLLLVMGLLHATTLIVLPAVALVHNSTRRGRALPRWLRNVAVIVLVIVLWQLGSAVVGLILIGGS